MIARLKLLIYRKIMYPFYIFRKRRSWDWLLIRSLVLKKCYFGPLTGEFGHLLGHNLPFLAYLYSKGVKIEFCGMEIHRPFFVDENGNEIVNSFLELRDFFEEFPPTCNTSVGQPADVEKITAQFIKTAKESGYPYWDNSDRHIYFYYFRWWLLKRKLIKVYNLSTIYKTANEHSVVIFPRKWNPNFPEKVDDQRRNNGLNWNYYDMAKLASTYFDKVYVLGHPVFSGVSFDSFDNVEVIPTKDNKVILEKCANAKLIVSQHSGTVYLGEYTRTPVLIVYKGGTEIGDIGMTTKFKNGLGRTHDFRFAFSMEEVEQQFRSLHTLQTA